MKNLLSFIPEGSGQGQWPGLERRKSKGKIPGIPLPGRFGGGAAFQSGPVAGITPAGMSQFLLAPQNRRQFSPRKAGFFGTLSQPEVAFIFLRAFKATGCGQSEMSGRSF